MGRLPGRDVRSGRAAESVGSASSSTVGEIPLTIVRFNYTVRPFLQSLWEDLMRRLALIASITLLLSPLAAYAQRTTASIRGTVRDATQGVLPGVTVTATNEDTGLVRSVVTNDAGVYSAADLPIGRYKVEAELASFKKAITHRTWCSEWRTNFSIDFELVAPASVTDNGQRRRVLRLRSGCSAATSRASSTASRCANSR